MLALYEGALRPGRVGPRRRPGGDPRADRLPRRQLLQPAAHRRRARRPARCRPARREPPPPTTAMGWEVDPDGLHEVLTRLRRDYGPLPIYITENGASFDDPPGRERPRRGPRAHRLPAGPPRRARPRRRRRRRRAPLLRLVAAGQLRVGSRATTSASASSTSTSPPRRACPSAARSGTATSSPASARQEEADGRTRLRGRHQGLPRRHRGGRATSTSTSATAS